MATIRIPAFEGRLPRVNPKLLADTQAQVATNCDLETGQIRPLPAPLLDATVNGLRVTAQPSVTWTAIAFYVDDFVYYAIDGKSYRCIADTTNEVPTDTSFWIEDFLYIIDSGTSEVSSVDTVADVGDSLDGTYFLISTLNQDFHVWFNTSGGAAVDPSPGTSLPIEVAITTGDTAPAVATAIKAELDKRQAFSTAISSNELTITHTFYFDAADVTDASAGTSGFTVAIDTPGVFGNYVVTGDNIETVYLLVDSWLNWSVEVDVVKSFVAGNDNRIYYTGDGIPKQTEYDIAIVGDFFDWPTSSWRLGIPAPAAALTVGTSTPGGASGFVNDMSGAWVYTYVTTWGEESAPSPPSDVTAIAAADQADLTGYVDPSLSDVDVITVRTYRVAAGTDGAEYLLLPGGDLAIATAVASGLADEDEDADLLEAIATVGFAQPPTDLSSIIQASENTLAGISAANNSVVFAEPGFAYAWPEKYEWPIAETPRALAVANEAVIVLTDNVPSVISGIDPASQSKIELQFQQKILSGQKGVVASERGILYPAEDGLALVNITGGDVLTSDILTKEQWQAYDLANAIGEYYDNKYYCFFDDANTGFYFDTVEKKQIIDFELTGFLFHDSFFDGSDLYVLLENLTDGDFSTYKWEQATTFLTYTWRSKIFQFFDTETFSRGQCFVDGTVTMTLYSDGVLKHTETVTDGIIFIMPTGYQGKEVQIELIGTGTVDMIAIATSVDDLING